MVAPFEDSETDADNTDADNPADEEVVRMNSTQKLLDYVEEIFPAVFSTRIDSTWNRIFTEIKTDHLIMRMLNERDDFYRRILYFEFFTLVNITVLISAIITGLEMKEDDGECASYLNEQNCLDKTSIYDYSRTKCLWDDKTQICSYHKDLSFNWYVMLASFFLILIISVPLRVLLTFTCECILRAPTMIERDEDDDVIR